MATLPIGHHPSRHDDHHHDVNKIDQQLSCEDREKKFDVKSFLGEDGIEIDHWMAPLHIRNGYRIYRAGTDLEKRPVWIVELGRWDVKKIVGSGEQEVFVKYVMQAVRRAVQSTKENNTPEHPVHGVMVIVDMQGLKMAQLLSIQTVSFMIQLARTCSDHIDYLELGIAVNTNSVAMMAINLVRPVLGKIMDRIHICGYNRDKWTAKIMAKVDPSQIPPEYGGTGDQFSPVLETK